MDGNPHEVDGLKYLLSPKDLAAWEDIGDLIDIGIVSLKIEGRLKSPEYVAATVQSYRAAVEKAMEGQELSMDEPTRRKLEMTFSRGFTGGYLHETNHQVVVEGRFPKKRGLYIGKVVGTRRDGVVIEAVGPVRVGDGVVFDAGRPDLKEQGGRIYTIDRGPRAISSFEPLEEKNDGGVELFLRFGKGAIDQRNIEKGQLVWKTSDQHLDAELKASYEGESIHHRRPIKAIVAGKIGEPLSLTLEDREGNSVTVQDTAPAEEARKRPLTREFLQEQIARLGNTPFELSELELRIEGNLMVPVSRLNDLRRRAVEELTERRIETPTVRKTQDTIRDSLFTPSVTGELPPSSASTLSVLCRTLEQVRTAVEFGDIDTIYTDFEDIRLHKEAREIIPSDGPRFVPATLRILKPGEVPFAKKLLDANPDAVLIRNLAGWKILKDLQPDLEMIGDYPLNVANHLTADLLFQHGFKSLTPSYDLNIDQLIDLLTMRPGGAFEVTIHQYMPMFHMEHCVFCRFLSDGTDHTNCGRPCESHDVRLKDRMGFEHPLKADAGCRNTVFNAIPQSASAYLSRVLDAGVRRFRVDLLMENADQTRKAIDSYLPCVKGERDGGDLWRYLRATSKLGVTRGSLDHD